MAGNYPDGVNQRIFDEAHEFMDEPRCEGCKQGPCECCRECGATPEQACEKWCGLPTTDGSAIDL